MKQFTVLKVHDEIIDSELSQYSTLLIANSEKIKCLICFLKLEKRDNWTKKCIEKNAKLFGEKIKSE